MNLLDELGAVGINEDRIKLMFRVNVIQRERGKTILDTERTFIIKNWPTGKKTGGRATAGFKKSCNGYSLYDIYMAFKAGYEIDGDVCDDNPIINERARNHIADALDHSIRLVHSSYKNFVDCFFGDYIKIGNNPDRTKDVDEKYTKLYLDTFVDGKKIHSTRAIYTGELALKREDMSRSKYSFIV